MTNFRQEIFCNLLSSLIPLWLLRKINENLPIAFASVYEVNLDILGISDPLKKVETHEGGTAKD